MEMMEMTALQSLKDPHMIYLDIAAGIGGVILYNLIEGDRKSFTISKINWKLVLVVLISRIVIDFGYHVLVSKTSNFGGSNNEFIFSSLLFLAIIVGIFNFKTDKAVSLYLSTALTMFAVARITHWG